MPYPSVLPDREGLARLLRRHRRDTCPVRNCEGTRHTYAEIAAAFGVHKSAVYQAMRKAGLTKEGSRVNHTDTLPWKLRAEHRYELPAEILRLLGRVRRGDQNIPEVKQRMMMRWLTDLIQRGEVVSYDPEVGWRFVPREPGDADVIRPPDYAGPEVYSDPKEQEIWAKEHLTTEQKRRSIGKLQQKRKRITVDLEDLVDLRKYQSGPHDRQ